MLEQSFTYQTKLTGSSSAGARFGTALVTLGDLDLDGFNGNKRVILSLRRFSIFFMSRYSGVRPL